MRAAVKKTEKNGCCRARQPPQPRGVPGPQRGSAILLTRIVVGIHVLETQRTDGRYLGHVLAGLRPVEVGRVAGQNDDAVGRQLGIHFCMRQFGE